MSLSAEKVVKFESCQCGATDKNKGAFNQELARSDEARTDAAGKVIAVYCGRCQLPVRLFCRVCPTDFGKASELAARLEASVCGMRDRVWRAQQTGGRKSKKAAPNQVALFPEEMAKPSRMKAARR